MTYASSLAAGRKTVAYGRGTNTLSFRAPDRALGPISNTIILIVLALVLGLFYLAQVTKTNAHGYEIERLRQERSSLNAEHDDLTIASARLQSLEKVQNSDVAKGLVSVAPSATVNP